jgi:hypothetical protein
MDGDVRDMKIITTSGNRRILVVAVNNGRVLTFSLKK